MPLSIQREEQRPDALGRLDEAQDATDAEHADDAEKGRRDVQLGEHVRHHQTCQQTTGSLPTNRVSEATATWRFTNFVLYCIREEGNEIGRVRLLVSSFPFCLLNNWPFTLISAYKGA